MISEKAFNLIQDLEYASDTLTYNFSTDLSTVTELDIEDSIKRYNEADKNLTEYMAELEEQNKEMFEIILIGSRLDSDDWFMSSATNAKISNMYDERRIKVLENKAKKPYKEILTGETLWNPEWE